MNIRASFLWLCLAILFLSQPAIAQKKGQVQSLLQAGPMVGYVEMMEAAIWVQTTQAAEVAVRYKKKEDKGAWLQSKSISSTEKSYLTAQVNLIDLEPGSLYEYEVLINGVAQKRPYPTEFKTQELWQWRKPAPDFTIAMGSCLFINDTPLDRPGNPYGGEYEILQAIHSMRPDLMIWTGDNVYLREPDFYSVARLNYRYRHTRAIPEMQALLASSANYAMWDDHDYGPNDSDRSYRMKEQVLDIFKYYWANPAYGHDGNPGTYYNFLYNDVEFFMLDNRYHRAPNNLKDDQKDYLGKKQLDWLKDALVASRAPFKIIVNGNQVLNMNNPYEAYHLYPAEHQELLSFLEENNISGVVFMSGDRHHTELLKVNREGNYPLYEFTNSPLTAGPNRNLRDEMTNPLRVDGTLVQERNFGFAKVTGPRNNRLLTLQTLDKDGKVLWEYEISEKELKKP